MPQAEQMPDLDRYNVAAIRQLLEDAFDARDLKRFCQDRSELRRCLIDFGLNASLGDMIDVVITHCQKQLLFRTLLAGIEGHNPNQFERYKDQIVIRDAPEVEPQVEPQTGLLETARQLDELLALQIPALGLDLTITRQTGGGYHFHYAFRLAPTPPQDPRPAEISVSLQLDVSRHERHLLTTKARQQLHNTARLYALHPEPGRIPKMKAIQALAQLGWQFYQTLFDTPHGRVLAEWMREHLLLRAAVRILDRTGDFDFPWSLIYEASPWTEDRPIDVTRFWGWRYRVSMLSDELLDTYEDIGETIEGSAGLKMLVSLNARLRGAADQSRFFEELPSRVKRQPTTATMVTSPRRAMDALKEADQHLIYFYCFRYADKMAGDRLPDIVMMAFSLADAGTLDAVERVERLDAMFDVSGSWLRLTRGKLSLAMLRDLGPGRFPRHPLVFLNADESALMSPPLSGGFIPFLVQRGARAVIGLECPLVADFADRFAREFWRRFLEEGRSVGEIVLTLRRHYLEEHNPLALAYTLYGSPEVQLSSSP